MYKLDSKRHRDSDKYIVLVFIAFTFAVRVDLGPGA